MWEYTESCYKTHLRKRMKSSTEKEKLRPRPGISVLSLGPLMNCKWPQNTHTDRQKTIWLLCLPACLFFCCVNQCSTTRGLTDKGPAGWRGDVGWAGLSDGCPIHHGGPCWWAKEPTCGGEREVVSKESAVFDYSRSIIQTRAAQNLSVWWQQAEWLLPLWAKSNVLTVRKRQQRGQQGCLEQLGESSLLNSFGKRLCAASWKDEVILGDEGHVLIVIYRENEHF